VCFDVNNRQTPPVQYGVFANPPLFLLKLAGMKNKHHICDNDISTRPCSCYDLHRLCRRFFYQLLSKYGRNVFTDNGDGTITDSATQLMWVQDDSGKGFAWEAALA
jgi:hypothetical protein